MKVNSLDSDKAAIGSKTKVNKKSRKKKKSAANLLDYPGFRFITVLFYGFLYTPIAILILFSFNSTVSVSVWEEFSFKWYPVALQNDDILKAIYNTFLVGTVATLASTLLAIPSALVIAGRNVTDKRDAKFMALFSLPLMIPEIVIGIAMLVFFSSIGLKLGLGNIMIGHTVFCIPFAFLPIAARLRSLEHGLSEAAFDLYANRWQCFKLVILPLLWPGIISGAMLAFIISFDNFIITLMISGAGGTTLPLYIYGLVKTQITPEVNAISTLALLVSFTLLILAFILTKGRILGGGGDTH